MDLSILLFFCTVSHLHSSQKSSLRHNFPPWPFNLQILPLKWQCHTPPDFLKFSIKFIQPLCAWLPMQPCVWVFWIVGFLGHRSLGGRLHGWPIEHDDTNPRCRRSRERIYEQIIETCEKQKEKDEAAKGLLGITLFKLYSIFEAD